MFKDIFKFSAAALVLSVGLAGCGAEPQDWADALVNAGEQLNLNNTPPVIVLKGPNSVEITVNGTYTEPGFVALDNEDGELTHLVQSNESELDTSVPGTFTIIYRVKDSKNLSAPLVARIVTVVEDSHADPDPTPEPPKEPDVSTPLVANDNHYTIEANRLLSAEGTQGVGNNDTFDPETTAFSVVTYPQNGDLMLGVDGLFTYQPDAGFTGTDTFVYQIANNTETATANASITVVASSETSEGFTAFKPSSDSRTIYVSDSVGNDSNDCLSEAEPCKSIESGIAKMRDGHPDHLYLKRGDTWTEQTLARLPSGRNSDEPAVLAFYGDSGDRPILANSSSALNTVNQPISHVAIIGLHFYTYKLDPKHQAFTGNSSDRSNFILLGGNKNVLLEDNKFDLSEMVIQGWETGDPENITLRRNIFTGSYNSNTSYNRDSRPSNLFASGVDGLLIEENVFDHGGWHAEVPGAGANMFNHNLYIQHSTVGNNLTVRNNIVTRASSHGIHGRPGGRYEDNFFAKNAISLQMGYNGYPLAPGTRAEAVNNVITEGHSMIKGHEACTGAGLCTPALWGLYIDEPGEGQFTVTGNIVSGLNQKDTDWTSIYNNLRRVALRVEAAQTAQNNIAYQWNSPEQGVNSDYLDPTRSLSDYNEVLSGENSFDGFMDTALNRPLQTWDERYSAKSINQFIRDGFQPQ